MFSEFGNEATSSSIPTVDEAIEYAQLSKLVHKLASKDDTDEFKRSGLTSLNWLHYVKNEKNKSVCMVVTSESNKYVAYVLGGPEDDWENQRALPIRGMGPKYKNENLPFDMQRVIENEDMVLESELLDSANDATTTKTETTATTTAATTPPVETKEKEVASETKDTSETKETTPIPQEAAAVNAAAAVEEPPPPPPKPIEIHPGINNALFDDNFHIKLENNLNEIIKTRPEHRVIITGFGMGAAMATVFAAYISKQKPILDVEVINFGSPRIGTEQFCLWMDEIPNLMIWRYVLKFDAIVGIPSFAIGFRHVGHMMHLNGKDGITKAYHNCAGLLPSDYVKPPELLTPLTELEKPIEDHDIGLYIKFLKEKSKASPRTNYASMFEMKSTGGARSNPNGSLLEKCLNIIDKTCGGPN